MATLLIAVVLGVLFAGFATQNTGPVTLYFGSHAVPDIPIYLAILIPLLIGLVLAFLFHLAKDLSHSLTIGEQKEKIKTLKKEVAAVTKDAHKFQLENTKIKEEGKSPSDLDAI